MGKKVLGEQEENMTPPPNNWYRKWGRSVEDPKDASSRVWGAYHSLDCPQWQGKSACGGQEGKKAKVWKCCGQIFSDGAGVT